MSTVAPVSERRHARAIAPRSGGIHGQLRDQFPVTELIGQVRVPTAVVYGSADMIVPPEQSAAVAAAAGGPVRVVEVAGADPNDVALLEGNELVAAVLDLARSLT